ncbi:MAG TPA: FtsX-like permease family protein [Rectinemataceae bacterium]|nr:FtsX-like permease family protein [Rectinemataceae bacterium]
MKTIRLALRNLSRQKKRTVLLGGAIAFGIMVVTVINGFVGAFIINISENFANLAAGHIFVQGVEKSASGREFEVIHDDSVLMAAAKEAGIPAEYVTKRSSIQQCSLVFAGKTATLNIEGVDFASETFLPSRLVFKHGGMAGMKDRQGLIISEPIAKRLDVQIGDRVLAQMRTYTGQNNVGEFAIAGITVDPGILGSMAGYANKDYVNELLNLGPGDYQTLGFYLPSLAGMDKYGTALYDDLKAQAQVFDRSAAKESQNFVRTMMQQGKNESWTGTKYRVFTLDDMLAQVKQIVQVLDTASLVILIVLFVIIMVGITNTFRIIMYERIREIGTMRSIGMQRGEVRGLFLLEAGFLALGGVIAGLALAVLVMGVVSLVNFGLDSALFIILKNGHMTFRLGLGRTLTDVFIVAALSLGAAFFPARMAARLDPAVALRTVK